MGFFTWFKPKQEQKSDTITTSYDLLNSLMIGMVSRSGVDINVNTALECNAVLACVRVIANGLSQVPFRLYRQEGDVRKPAMRHQLFDLMATAPNEWQTSFEFRQMIAMHLCLTGNAFVWINRVQDRIVELLPYTPGSVSIHRNGWNLEYSITLQNKKYVTVPASDMWHIRWLSWDGVCGLDAVRAARDTIGLSLALERYGATTFKNGVRPSGVLTVSHQLNESQRKELRDAFESAFSGTENSGRVPVLGADMKWQQMGVANDNAQFVESRKYQLEEICRAFGVPPIMIGYSDKASTYASAEQMFLSHVVHTMGPWYACLEQSANKTLLTKNERKAGYYFKFNDKALLRGDSKARANFYTSLYNIGAISPNEIRELEDMNPYEGGDEYRVPLNMENPGNADDEGEKDGKY